MPKNRDPKFTIEELIQLKKGERPDAKFWDTFERELHVKQRKLLQQQPVDDSAFENEFWRRFKRITALCTATVSCGAFGFIVVNTISNTAQKTQPQMQPEQSGSMVAQNELSAPVAPQFEVAVNEPAAIEEPKFVEVKASPKSLLDIPHKTTAVVAASYNTSPSPEAIAAAIDDEVPLLDLDKFRTEFETFDPETAVASISVSNVARSTVEDRYTHPLSDLGYNYDRSASAGSNTLDRISNLARKTDFFDRNSSFGMKLDTVSLKF